MSDDASTREREQAKMQWRDGGLPTHLAALASVALSAPDALTMIEPRVAAVAAYTANLMAGQEVAQGLVRG